MGSQLILPPAVASEAAPCSYFLPRDVTITKNVVNGPFPEDRWIQLTLSANAGNVAYVVYADAVNATTGLYPRGGLGGGQEDRYLFRLPKGWLYKVTGTNVNFIYATMWT